jgi:hypothetical protein
VAELQRKCAEYEAMNELDRLRLKVGGSSESAKAPSPLTKLRPPTSVGSSNYSQGLGLQVDVAASADADDWATDYNERVSPRSASSCVASKLLPPSSVQSAMSAKSVSVGSAKQASKQTASFYHAACGSPYQVAAVSKGPYTS